MRIYTLLSAISVSLLAVPVARGAFPLLSDPLVDYRAVNGKWQPQVSPSSGAEGVELLGKAANASMCASMAQKTHGFSYTWHGPEYDNSSWTGLCFTTTSSYYEWFPYTAPGAISGRIWWGCKASRDCSLNGKCVDGLCVCRKGWTGHACTALDIRPTTRDSGYRAVQMGKNTSSWGGPVLRHGTTYHMFASEMEGNCGLNSWATNSIIVRAEASSPLGPFERREKLFPVFSHEADAKLAPDGTLALFFTQRSPDKWPVCTCVDGHTDPGCSLFPASPDRDPTVLSTAPSPLGPWSRPVQVMKDTVSDTNLTPLIFNNGSLVGLFRSFYNTSNSTTYSHIHRVTASNWTDPETYRYKIDVSDSILSLRGPTEDPFLYLDPEGGFHAIFHNMYGCFPCGGHAFSEDGVEWVYTGGDAYSDVICYIDGGCDRVARRERPHLLFAGSGDPVMLTTGVVPRWDPVDYSYTSAVPVGEFSS